MSWTVDSPRRNELGNAEVDRHGVYVSGPGALAVVDGCEAPEQSAELGRREAARYVLELGEVNPVAADGMGLLGGGEAREGRIGVCAEAMHHAIQKHQRDHARVL